VRRVVYGGGCVQRSSEGIDDGSKILLGEVRLVMTVTALTLVMMGTESYVLSFVKL